MKSTSVLSIFIVISILFGGLLSVEASKYKWQDKNGGWHFSDNAADIPPEIRENMPFYLQSVYKKCEENNHVFRYLGYERIKIKEGIFLSYGDFFVVDSEDVPRSFNIRRDYPNSHYNCLVFWSNNTYYRFSLHLAHFVAKTIESTNTSRNADGAYEEWKSLRTGNTESDSRSSSYRNNTSSRDRSFERSRERDRRQRELDEIIANSGGNEHNSGSSPSGSYSRSRSSNDQGWRILFNSVD